MDTLLRDLRFAVRRLAKAPLFTMIAVVSLAIGIGANTAIFTMVNTVMLQRTPVADVDEVVEIYRSVAGFSHATFAYPDYVDLRAEMGDTYAELGGAQLTLVQMDEGSGIETLPAELVTGTYFDLLGLQPAAGRLLGPDDDVTPGGHPVVVLGHTFWQTRFDGDPSVVGTTLRLNGRSYDVVGVAPRGYDGTVKGIAPSFIAPIAMISALQPSERDPLQARGNQSLFLKGRLNPGVPVERAQAAADRFAEAMRRDFSDYWAADNRILLVPSADVIMNPMVDRVLRPAAWMLMTVVGLVLLIACANLASFLLAQATDRRKEIAVRLALGARRSTLVRQLLTESVVLSVIGGIGGVALSVILLRVLVRADLPLPLPIQLDLSPNGAVFAFASLVTVGAALLFGLIPALQASNPDVAPTLKDEGTGGGAKKRFTLRGSLVVTQVALCMVLLTASGLFLRSLQARLAVDPGFGDQPAGLLTVQASPDRYEREEGRQFFRTLMEEAARIPGVTAAGMTYDLHLSSFNNSSMGVQVAGIDPPPGQDYHLVEYSEVDSGFFEAAGVDILRGRNFDEGDTEEVAEVAIVSEAFAALFWPGEDALGRTFVRSDDEYTVVGIARDAKVRSLGESPRPFVYRPWEQEYSSTMTVVAATNGDADRVAVELMGIARGLDPDILVFEQKTMERHLASMILGARLGAMVITVFGLVALLLASIGLYGVVSYAVATRQREMGIRMALGAESGDVMAMLVRNGMSLVAVGGIVGLVASFFGARLLSSLIYGVEATDPVTFVVTPLVLGSVALLAALLPARRVSGISPVVALKGE